MNSKQHHSPKPRRHRPRGPDRSELLHPEQFSNVRDFDHSPNFSAILQESGYRSVIDYDHETFTADVDFGTHPVDFEAEDPPARASHYTSPGPTSPKEAAQAKNHRWHSQIESGHHPRADGRVHQEIHDRLTDHPGIDATSIDIEVDDSVVRLTGTVETRLMKRLVEDVIESVPGVTIIENYLKIESLNSTEPKEGPTEQLSK